MSGTTSVMPAQSRVHRAEAAQAPEASGGSGFADVLAGLTADRRDESAAGLADALGQARSVWRWREPTRRRRRRRHAGQHSAGTPAADPGAGSSAMPVVPSGRRRFGRGCVRVAGRRRPRAGERTHGWAAVSTEALTVAAGTQAPSATQSVTGTAGSAARRPRPRTTDATLTGATLQAAAPGSSALVAPPTRPAGSSRAGVGAQAGSVSLASADAAGRDGPDRRSTASRPHAAAAASSRSHRIHRIRTAAPQPQLPHRTAARPQPHPRIRHHRAASSRIRHHRRRIPRARDPLRLPPPPLARRRSRRPRCCPRPLQRPSRRSPRSPRPRRAQPTPQ